MIQMAERIIGHANVSAHGVVDVREIADGIDNKSLGGE
jgi:hypothetical protein